MGRNQYRQGTVIAKLMFFFNDTATAEIYTLSLHDALPISLDAGRAPSRPTHATRPDPTFPRGPSPHPDRKSTRLNSSHANISYAVFCLKKKYLYLALPSSSSLLIIYASHARFHDSLLTYPA